jgi:hypothetical protein
LPSIVSTSASATSAVLARLGHLAPSGKPYEAMSVKRMLER